MKAILLSYNLPATFIDIEDIVSIDAVANHSLLSVRTKDNCIHVGYRMSINN